MGYTAQESADATGKSKTTITRAVKKGIISAGKNAHGRLDIDPAELHRVYPPILTVQRDAPMQNGANNASHTEEIVSVYREQNADLRKQVDDLTGLLQQAQSTIHHQTIQLSAPPPPPKRSWWKSFFSNTSQPLPERETA